MKAVDRLAGLGSGQIVVTDDTTHTGEFFAFHALTPCVVNSVTFRAGYSVTGSWASLTSIPAGAVVGGYFTSFKLTSGEGILYKI